jgi:hypothetical protein
VNPDETALLSPRNLAFYRYEIWRRAVKMAARPVFGMKMRPGRGRRKSVSSPAVPVE